MSASGIQGEPVKQLEKRSPVYPLSARDDTYYFEPLDSTGNSDGKTPIYYWTLLRENARKIGSFAGMGLLIGWLIAAAQTPLFRSAAAIEIQSMSQSEALYGIIERDWAAGGAGGNSLPPEAYLQTQIELLNGRSFMNRVFEKVENRPSTLR